MNRNFFDDLNPIDIEEAQRQQADAEEKGKRLDYLIHTVFFQNDDGAALLEIWKESLLMAAVVHEDGDIMTAGIREGMNRFIRGIILTIKRINEGDR